MIDEGDFPFGGVPSVGSQEAFLAKQRGQTLLKPDPSLRRTAAKNAARFCLTGLASERVARVLLRHCAFRDWLIDRLYGFLQNDETRPSRLVFSREKPVGVPADWAAVVVGSSDGFTVDLWALSALVVGPVLLEDWPDDF